MQWHGDELTGLVSFVFTWELWFRQHSTPVFFNFSLHGVLHGIKDWSLMHARFVVASCMSYAMHNLRISCMFKFFFQIFELHSLQNALKRSNLIKTFDKKLSPFLNPKVYMLFLQFNAMKYDKFTICSKTHAMTRCRTQAMTKLLLFKLNF